MLISTIQCGKEKNPSRADYHEDREPLFEAPKVSLQKANISLVTWLLGCSKHAKWYINEIVPLFLFCFLFSVVLQLRLNIFP
jgi:hypothetical protein